MSDKKPRNKIIETNSGLVVEEFNNEVIAAQEENIKGLLRIARKIKEMSIDRKEKEARAQKDSSV